MAKTWSLKSTQNAISLKTIPKGEYINGQPTGKMEHIEIALATEAGEIHLLLPPVEGKIEELKKRFPFGTLIEIEEMFDIEDIKVSIYKDELSVKIFAGFKEEK